MPSVSLTDFVDFVVASGVSRLTKVRQIKNRPDYHPRFDFWKDLREGIIVYHGEGTNDKRNLGRILTGVSDAAKRETYRPVIDNYKKFLGRKTITTLEHDRALWTYKDLEVRVNPELRLEIAGDAVPVLVKLYFKAAVLSKGKVDVILLLMKHAVPVVKGDAFALLDVKHNRVYKAQPNDALLPLLYGEADSFLTIWNTLEP